MTIGSPISDSATLSGATANAGGTITFRLYSNATCTTEVTTGLTPVTVNGNGNYGSGNYTPTAVGTYYWIASYSGDASNEAASGACGDTGESSIVNRASSGIVTSQTITPQDSATISATAGRHTDRDGHVQAVRSEQLDLRRGRARVRCTPKR